METILAAIFAPLVGFGAVTFIFAHLLSKSNNIGSEKAEPGYYATLRKFDARINNISRQESVSCSMSYRQDLERYAEPDPSEEVHVITPEEAARMAVKKKSKDTTGPKILQDQYNFDEDLPPVDGPLFKPLE